MRSITKASLLAIALAGIFSFATPSKAQAGGRVYVGSRVYAPGYVYVGRPAFVAPRVVYYRRYPRVWRPVVRPIVPAPVVTYGYPYVYPY